jgi:hypothetical protein
LTGLSGTDRSFKTLFADFYAWASARPKPIMVGEYGVLETWLPNQKADWVNAARTAIQTDFPAVAAVNYFNSWGNDNSGNYRDWRMDTSSSSLSAFASMGSDPYFNPPPGSATPETTVSGPSGTVASSSATFTFSADRGGATFECRLNGAAFAPCTSPATASGLADGSHSFEVRATVAGRTDPTPAARSWTIDTTGPAVSSVNPADGPAGVPRLSAPTSRRRSRSRSTRPR